MKKILIVFIYVVMKEIIWILYFIMVMGKEKK